MKENFLITFDLEFIIKEDVDLTNEEIRLVDRWNAAGKNTNIKKQTCEEYVKENIKNLVFDNQYNKVVVVALMHNGLKEPIGMLSDNEEELMKFFKENVDEAVNYARNQSLTPVFAGTNIVGCDVPIIIDRFVKMNMKFEDIRMSTSPYKNKDTFTIYPYISLDVLAKRFNMEGKMSGVDGSQVEKMWKNKEFDKLLAYGKQDTGCSHSICERLFAVVE